MREDTQGEWEEGIRRCGAREVLKAWCEVRTGRTPCPSDVAEERMRPCGIRLAMISIGRTVEKLGPALYSPDCVEGNFLEVHRTCTLVASNIRRMLSWTMRPCSC
jgi:hypothetical protein